MPELTADALLNIGFCDVGFWTVQNDRLKYAFDGENAVANKDLFLVSNVLYAFVEGDEVKYIGKTTQSLRSRFAGYCNPSERQSTNTKNNANLREIISRGIHPRIFVFAPITLLNYGDFPINLAAGLEDALVSSFTPAWNGARAGQRITETAELEGEALHDLPAEKPPVPPAQPDFDPDRTCDFTISLGQAYYHHGIVNPGVEASERLGADGDPVTVTFSDRTPDITSRINRTANNNGSVRFVGRNRQIADWFQAHFRHGETVNARVLSPHRVILFAPSVK